MYSTLPIIPDPCIFFRHPVLCLSTPGHISPWHTPRVPGDLPHSTGVPRPSHYALLSTLKTRCGERKLPGLKREAHGDVWVINNRLSRCSFRGSQHGLSDRLTTIRRVNRWPVCAPSGLVLPRTDTRGLTHQARTASLVDVWVFGVDLR